MSSKVSIEYIISYRHRTTKSKPFSVWINKIVNKQTNIKKINPSAGAKKNKETRLKNK